VITIVGNHHPLSLVIKLGFRHPAKKENKAKTKAKMPQADHDTSHAYTYAPQVEFPAQNGEHF